MISSNGDNADRLRVALFDSFVVFRVRVMPLLAEKRIFALLAMHLSAHINLLNVRDAQLFAVGPQQP